MMNENKNANRVFFILLVISIILIVLRLTSTILAIKQLAYSILIPDIKISSTLFKTIESLGTITREISCS